MKCKIENVKCKIDHFRHLSAQQFLIPLSSFLILPGCVHREFDFEINDSGTSRVHVNVDWSELERHERPTGMTVICYPHDADSDGGETVTYLSPTTDRASLWLKPGEYDIVVFNQSDGEFGTFSFHDMESRENARIEAAEFTSRWYVSRSEGEITAQHPEWFAVAEITDVTVSPDDYSDIKELMKRGYTTTRSTLIAELTPGNIVSMKKIKIHIRNIYNLRSARGGISGLAAGLQMKGRRRHDRRVTHLVEEWTLTLDKDNSSNGCIESTFTCFGLPGNHTGASEENEVNVSFLLVDNETTLDYTFHVGHLIHNDTTDETIDIEFDDFGNPIVLPDVKPDGATTGGFDSNVTGWEDINVEVSI